MENLELMLSRYQPMALSLFRFITGLVLLQFGFAKILKIPAESPFAKVEITSLYGAAGCIELIFGSLLLLGLFSILPLGPPLAHPLWSYAPGAPASISLDPVNTRVELIKLLGLAAVFLIGASLGAEREGGERFAARSGSITG